jgi:hypothetical protein
MIRSSVLVGPGKGAESETYMSDYQETDYGVYMPYYIETRSNGQVAQKIVVEEIIINGEISDDVFAFPEPAEAAEEAPMEEEEPVEETEEDRG